MSKRKAKIYKPFWQTAPCPPWCQALHADADTPVARVHEMEEPPSVVLSTLDPTEFRGTSGTSRPFTLSVGLEQGYREVEPRVTLEQGIGRPEQQVDLYLTLHEAEKLARKLMRAVKLAGGAR